MAKLSVIAPIVAAICISFVSADCDCVSDPTQMCCMSWTYGSAQQDVDSLCTMMPEMFACGMNTLCKKGKLTGAYCHAFSLLSDICVSDHMAGMSGCHNYNILCTTNNTMVTECTQHGPMPNVLTTTNSKQAITSMCQMMYMKACDECASPTTGESCDCKNMGSNCAVPSSSSLLQVLSDMCLEMPMSGCSGFTSMCQTAGSDFDSVCMEASASKLCNGQGTVMYMNGFKGALHSEDTCVSFLFEKWVLDTKVKLAFGIIGAFLMGVLQGLLCSINSKINKRYPPKDSLSVGDGLRFFIFLLEATNGYALMLLAMTYFGGLFVAVVCGLALGRVLFNRKAVAVDCHGAAEVMETPSGSKICHK